MIPATARSVWTVLRCLRRTRSQSERDYPLCRKSRRFSHRASSKTFCSVAPMPRLTRRVQRQRLRQRAVLSKRFQTDMTLRSVSAVSCCPVVKNSASPSPVRSCAMRRYCCWTKRLRHWMQRANVLCRMPLNASHRAEPQS
ncbi:UNVERIFIED_CONTAM: hypothetical protein GTU68_038862 [Idotea baltica]|nr:hypothetical protein [Idotea baltica]